MKKNLLTVLLSMSILFFGAFLVRAETPSSTASQVTLSKNFAVAKRISEKINAMKVNCTAARYYCTEELASLIHINDWWMDMCSIYNNNAGCGFISTLLVDAGTRWENCINGGGNVAKNIDKTIDRNKRFKKDTSPDV